MSDIIKESLLYSLCFLTFFALFYSYNFFYTIRFNYKSKLEILNSKYYYRLNYYKYDYPFDILKVIKVFETPEKLKKYTHQLITIYTMLIFNIILVIVIPLLERL